MVKTTGKVKLEFIKKKSFSRKVKVKFDNFGMIWASDFWLSEVKKG